MGNLGFKELTNDNWLEPDATMSEAFELEPEMWMESVLEIQLNEKIPETVRNQYRMCQFSMVYGSLFYPILSLASEHLYRILENALDLKCKDMGLATEKWTFDAKVDKLVEENVLDEQNGFLWHNVKNIRFFVSHAGGGEVSAPNEALISLNRVKECLEGLY